MALLRTTFGIFAALNRQAKIAQREQERQQRLALREQSTAARRRDQQQKSLVRLGAQMEKAEAAERKRLEKEQREAYLASRVDEAEVRSEEVADALVAIDSLLQATLDRDDFVDLSTLRATATHPPFDRQDLARPITPPPTAKRPNAPVLAVPSPPTGLAKLLGKRKYEEAVAAAQASYRQALKAWEAECAAADEQDRNAAIKYAAAEQQRLESLAREQARFAEECRAREAAVVQQNLSLDELIANLGYGTPDAVQAYIAIVLGNSVYPEEFPVQHAFEYDASTAELALQVRIPDPSQLPTEKNFKYVKASDEIVAVPLSQKECKDRYARALHQVALRSIHEVFEADRRGLIRTIALEVVTFALDERTGIRKDVPLAIVGAEREAFLALELVNVIPLKTLDHLGAAVSKNPFALVPAERTGVRRA
jgi:restriction system protein